MSRLILIPLIISLYSCASNSTYRSDNNKICALGDQSCEAILELSKYKEGSAQAKEQQIINSKVALSFIEINDQGVLREREQLDSAINTIKLRGQSKNRKQMVVVFIHGWKHNAKASDENVDVFRKMLTQYAWINKSDSDVKVTGIYVGWRGVSMTIPLLKYLTFWDRKIASAIVGQGALVEVLSAVEQASKQTNSRMASIGHSFGGSALFNATKSIFISRLYMPPSALSSEQFPNQATVGDMVIIINPAFEAMQFWPLHSAMKANVKSANISTTNAGPRLLILQGQKDAATRLGFPFGRSLIAPLQAHAADSDSMDSEKNTANGVWMCLALVISRR